MSGQELFRLQLCMAKDSKKPRTFLPLMHIIQFGTLSMHTSECMMGQGPLYEQVGRSSLCKRLLAIHNKIQKKNNQMSSDTKIAFVTECMRHEIIEVL